MSNCTCYVTNGRVVAYRKATNGASEEALLELMRTLNDPEYYDFHYMWASESVAELLLKENISLAASGIYERVQLPDLRGLHSSNEIATYVRLEDLKKRVSSDKLEHFKKYEWF